LFIVTPHLVELIVVNQFYHFSPNCSPPELVRTPPLSGPLRLGTASSRGDSATSAVSFESSPVFSGLAIAAFSDRLIRCASESTSSTLHSTSCPSFTTFSTLYT